MILSTTFHDWMVAGAWIVSGLAVIALVVSVVVVRGVMKEHEERRDYEN